MSYINSRSMDSNRNSYPNHEYSKYIDPQMSFSNQVSYPSKSELVDALKNVRCSGGIMLEPRLQEYLKKKKYYKENNIKPCFSLESEFQITNVDRRVLRAFLMGARDMYDPKNIAFSEFIDDSKQTKRKFPSNGYRDDPRVQKIKKPCTDRPINRGMFVPDGPGEYFYEDPITPVDDILDARDLKSKITGFNIDDTRFDPRTDPYMDPGIESYNKLSSQYRIDPNDEDWDTNNGSYSYIENCNKDNNKNNKNKDKNNKNRDNKDKYNKDKYNKDTNNKYNRNKINTTNNINRKSNDLHEHGSNNMHEIDYSMDAKVLSNNIHKSNSKGETMNPNSYRILGQGMTNNSYGKFDKPNFSEKTDMDIDNKMVIPKISSRDRRGLSTCDYILGTYPDQKPILKDADFESTLIRGMPSNTKKSYGYRNPVDHYYQYIDNDFQNPDNSVESYPRGGEGTRSLNRSMVRQQHTREIL